MPFCVIDCARHVTWIVSLEFHNTLNEVITFITPNLQVSQKIEFQWN